MSHTHIALRGSVDRSRDARGANARSQSARSDGHCAVTRAGLWLRVANTFMDQGGTRPRATREARAHRVSSPRPPLRRRIYCRAG